MEVLLLVIGQWIITFFCASCAFTKENVNVMTAQAYSQYDVAVCDRYPLPRRQTEIPTDLFSEVVGIIVLQIFVEDLDLVIEQDNLI